MQAGIRLSRTDRLSSPRATLLTDHMIIRVTRVVGRRITESVAIPFKTERRFDHWEQITPGTQSALQYDESVADLVAFLQWAGEPAQSTRTRVGVWVLLFLGLLTVLVWRLNAAYWRDVT